MKNEQVEIVMRVVKDMQRFFLLRGYSWLGLPDDEENSLETEKDMKRFREYLEQFDIDDSEWPEEYKAAINEFDGLFGSALTERIIRALYEGNLDYYDRRNGEEDFIDLVSDAFEVANQNFKELALAVLKSDLEAEEIDKEHLGMYLDEDLFSIRRRNMLLLLSYSYAEEYYKEQNDVENAHRCRECIAMLLGCGDAILGRDYLYGICVQKDAKKALDCYVQAPNEYFEKYFLEVVDGIYNYDDISSSDLTVLYQELESVKQMYMNDVFFCYNYAIAFASIISDEELFALVNNIKVHTGHENDDNIKTIWNIDPFELFFKAERYCDIVTFKRIH